MTRKKIIIILIIFLSALSIFIYVSIHGGQGNGNNLKSPESNNPVTTGPTLTPTPTIWLTPTPIILDLKNGLSKEVEKLNPEDFSSDFETLKNTAISF